MNEFEFEVLKRDFKEYNPVFFRIKNNTVGAFLEYNGFKLNVIHKFESVKSSKIKNDYSLKRTIIENLIIQTIDSAKKLLKTYYIEHKDRSNSLLYIDDFATFAYSQSYDFLNIYLDCGYNDLLDDFYEDIWSGIDYWDGKGLNGVEIYKKLSKMNGLIEVDKISKKYFEVK